MKILLAALSYCVVLATQPATHQSLIRQERDTLTELMVAGPRVLVMKPPVAYPLPISYLPVMEFGKLDLPELDSVDFGLPPDKPETISLLSRNSKAAQPSVYVGCAKWGRKDWVGRIYPEGTKEADFLSHYARHFNSIELNATFYRIPSRNQTAAWAKKVGDGFKFSPKFSQSISHIKRLKDVGELTDRFLTGISGFGDKLGPVFLMPNPAMGPKALDTLEAFIQHVANETRLFVELRHKDWFTSDEVFSLLEKNNVGAIITDAAGRRDCVHMRLTTPEAFIRFVGNGLHPTDYRRVDDWVLRIKAWLRQGLQTVYFFMHQQQEIHSPELAKYVIEQLNRECGVALPVPNLAA